MEQGSIIIKDLTGDWPVYPGHPLVLATAIMRVFPDFESANKPTEHGWCQALADSRIPGAGDHVGAAMWVLRRGANGEGVEAMLAYASDYWERGNAGGHVQNVEAGRKQATVIEQTFRDAAATWFEH